MLISAVQQSDSLVHIYIPFKILFYDGLLQDVACGFLFCTVGPCFLLLVLKQTQTLDLFFFFECLKFIFQFNESCGKFDSFSWKTLSLSQLMNRPGCQPTGQYDEKDNTPEDLRP